jgi:hypothetical protein
MFEIGYTVNHDPARFLTDAVVIQMTAEMECWYRRSVDLYWVNTYMPADPESFAQVVGKGCTVEAATYISEVFFAPKADADGCLVYIFDLEVDDDDLYPELPEDEIRAMEAEAARPAAPVDDQGSQI